MKIAIMQPYFFPYIGYFQLINAVDVFVIYDNIQYTKKGWINRNRIAINGKDDYFSVPLKKGSDFLNVVDRELADDWPKEKAKILNRIKENYQKAPFFAEVFPLIQRCFDCKQTNLFAFILYSVKEVMDYMSIQTKIIVSSGIDMDHSLKSEDKVIAICKALQAEHYINPIGGLQLYSKNTFESAGVGLQFLKTDAYQYPQFTKAFIPFLSVIDLMMFHSKNELQVVLTKFNLLEPE